MPGERIPQISEKSSLWVGPTIFVGAALLSQNSYAVSIALNVIATYLTDHVFKGFPGDPKVKLDIVVEGTDGSGTKKIHFEGPAEELEKVAQVIHEVAHL